MREAIIYNFCVCQHSPSTLKENQDTFGKIKPEDECKMNDYSQFRYHKGHEKERVWGYQEGISNVNMES